MLYLSGIILAFFLTFVLATKRNKATADYILMAWLAITGLQLLCFYMFFTGKYDDYSILIVLGFPLPLAHGPFLYLYTRQHTSSLPFTGKQWLHFLPLILSYCLFAPFFFLPPEQRAEVFRQEGRGYELQTMINIYAIYVSGVVYAALSIVRLLRYRKNLVHRFSNTDRINFNWLLYLIIWMSAIWIVVLFVRDDRVIYGAASFFILWLGYFGIKQARVFDQGGGEPLLSADKEEKGEGETETIKQDGSLKYQKSTLSERDVISIYQRLELLMQEEKPFKNPDLTLGDLAKSLDVYPNHLSQVINSRGNKNFYDLVNESRVEEFIRLTSQPENQQYTLLTLAYDCGFNSKASFNRNFKKHTGLTPSDYLRQKAVGQV